MLIMYCSAIFYYAGNMSGTAAKTLIKFNPLFGIIDNFRRALFGQGIDVNLLIYTGVGSIVLLAIGLLMFYRKQDDFILNI